MTFWQPHSSGNSTGYRSNSLLSRYPKSGLISQGQRQGLDRIWSSSAFAHTAHFRSHFWEEANATLPSHFSVLQVACCIQSTDETTIMPKICFESFRFMPRKHQQYYLGRKGFTRCSNCPVSDENWLSWFLHWLARMVARGSRSSPSGSLIRSCKGCRCREMEHEENLLMNQRKLWLHRQTRATAGTLEFPRSFLLRLTDNA